MVTSVGSPASSTWSGASRPSSTLHEDAIPDPSTAREDITVFQHPDWDDRPDEDLDISLVGAQADNWKNWTVKLEFTMQGGKRTGTAFYINLDQIKGQILLTAAHNLISDDGEMVQDMKIPGIDGPITTDRMFICEEYKKKPGPDSKIHDYGMILLESTPKSTPKGFGFSLKLAEASDVKLPAVNIIGYHPGTIDPEFNSGKVSRLMSKCIKYTVKAVAGNSGGPVWVGSDGRETVIGIHNYGGDPAKKGSPSQGTRIHRGVLHDICRWTAEAGCDVGHLSRRLKVIGLKPPHDEYTDPELSFYLRFTKGVLTAKARLGPEDLETTFDVVPGLTSAAGSAGSRRSPAKYVFMFKEPSSWQENSEDEDSGAEEDTKNLKNAIEKPLWVRWRTDVDINRVELSERLRDDSFVALQKKAKGFEVIRDKMKLRMVVDGVDVMPFEGPEGLYELYESEQVGFIPSERKHTDFPHCVFTFV
ncbi:hypothetical protein TWF281_003603 [Arthrobotrys megalospora]